MAVPSPSGPPGTGTTATSDETGKDSSEKVGIGRRILNKLNKLPYRFKQLFHTGEKDTPPQVVYPPEDGEKLEPEDFLRDIEIFFKIKFPDGSREESLGILPAKFDFGFDQGPDAPSCILLNRSMLPLDLPQGIVTVYEDPENPPVLFENADGTTIKLYGELAVRWAFRGVNKKYENQKLFPTGYKFIESTCFLMSEKSSLSCIVDWNTIKQNRLDRPPNSVIASLGLRDGPPATNNNLVQQKAPALEQQRRDEQHKQKKIQDQKSAADKEKRKKPKASKGT